MRLHALLLLVFAFPFVVNAQFIPNQPAVTISTSPTIPEPFAETVVSLDAYTLDTTGATISWFIDGVEEQSARNLRSLTLSAKALGQETEIAVRITQRDGQVITANHSVRPGQLDIVLEADTLVPAFYKGRPLLTVGSEVRAVAIPNLGDDRRPEGYSYLWQLNNEPLYGGAVTGKNAAVFTLGLGRSQILSTTVFNQSGDPVAKKSLVLDLAEPEIHFYSLNPLRGINQQAIGSAAAISGDELTVRAEPYYMSRDVLNQNPLIEWEIDGRNVEVDRSNPLELTLRRINDAGGSSNVEFHIRNLGQLVQGVRDSFRVIY
jgi:hypothetical protein